MEESRTLGNKDLDHCYSVFQLQFLSNLFHPHPSTQHSAIYESETHRASNMPCSSNLHGFVHLPSAPQPLHWMSFFVSQLILDLFYETSPRFPSYQMLRPSLLCAHHTVDNMVFPCPGLLHRIAQGVPKDKDPWPRKQEGLKSILFSACCISAGHMQSCLC